MFLFIRVDPVTDYANNHELYKDRGAVQNRLLRLVQVRDDACYNSRSGPN